VWIAGEGLRTVELTLDEVKTRFEQHTVSATLQCAGNRRHELKEVKPIEVRQRLVQRFL
jgi:sulfite oxidase